jgi:hypothetical protein
MATILELYNDNKDLSQRQGGPEAAIVDAKKFGTKGVPGVGFSSGDQTPYSAGTNIQGAKSADVAAIDKAADNSVISPGNRYGFAKADIGLGISEWPTLKGPGGVGSLARASWNDTKKYGASNPQ